MEAVKISSTAYSTANEPPTTSELFPSSAEDDLNLDIAHPPHEPTPHLERAETPDYLAEPGPDTGGGASMVSVLFGSHSLGKGNVVAWNVMV